MPFILAKLFSCVCGDAGGDKSPFKDSARSVFDKLGAIDDARLDDTTTGSRLTYDDHTFSFSTGSRPGRIPELVWMRAKHSSSASPYLDSLSVPVDHRQSSSSRDLPQPVPGYGSPSPLPVARWERSSRDSFRVYDQTERKHAHPPEQKPSHIPERRLSRSPNPRSRQPHEIHESFKLPPTPPQEDVVTRPSSWGASTAESFGSRMGFVTRPASWDPNPRTSVPATRETQRPSSLGPLPVYTHSWSSSSPSSSSSSSSEYALTAAASPACIRPDTPGCTINTTPNLNADINIDTNTTTTNTNTASAANLITSPTSFFAAAAASASKDRLPQQTQRSRLKEKSLPPPASKSTITRPTTTISESTPVAIPATCAVELAPQRRRYRHRAPASFTFSRGDLRRSISTTNSAFEHMPAGSDPTVTDTPLPFSPDWWPEVHEARFAALYLCEVTDINMERELKLDALEEVFGPT